jgi:hypothetical protein
MMSKPTPTFGKRGRPPPLRAAPPPRPAPAVSETSESGVPLSDLAAALMPSPADAEADERRARRTVPYSLRAGLLAGLVVSLMQAGLVIVAAKAQSASLAGLAAMTGVSPQDMLPLVVAGSLLDGAQATGFTVLTAHSVLKRFAVTGHAAYALGGAAAAAVYAVGALLLGFGAPAHGWAIELATGLGAGFFYRVFAGAASRARPA